eukprot:6175097-Pleurochrysis_carterae.AAC.2
MFVSSCGRACVQRARIHVQDAVPSEADGPPDGEQRDERGCKRMRVRVLGRGRGNARAVASVKHNGAICARSVAACRRRLEPKRSLGQQPHRRRAHRRHQTLEHAVEAVDCGGGASRRHLHQDGLVDHARPADGEACKQRQAEVDAERRMQWRQREQDDEPQRDAARDAQLGYGDAAVGGAPARGTVGKHAADERADRRARVEGRPDERRRAVREAGELKVKHCK